jgi:hypothetical protein
MAWIEQISNHSWRVRYPRPNSGGYATISGFPDAKTAEQYAQDMQTDRRRGIWIDPAASKTTVATWVDRWLPTLDVEIRTEENYRACLRNHILPRWGHIALGDITALDITAWLKQLRSVYATSSVATIRCVFSMLLDDAVNQHLIPTSPARQYRRRGRRDHAPSRAEKVFAMPDHVLRIAQHATELGGPSAGLLIITAAWTGCRWGEITGLNATTSTSNAAPSPSTPTTEHCTNPPPTDSGSDHPRHPPQHAPSPCRASWSSCSASTSLPPTARLCSPHRPAAPSAAATSTAVSSDPPSTATPDGVCQPCAQV